MTYQALVAATPAGRDRIVVDGTDITWFRGKRTPTPTYRLTEPFAYGSATLSIPQVSAHLESDAFGTGELRWLRKDARVKVQRVDPDTHKVIATDYRGVVTSIRVDGPTVTLELGGNLSGRAALRNRQLPLFRHVKDIGLWAFATVSDLHLRFTPRLGPTTGVELASAGGMTELAWLQQLCAMSTKTDGTQYTIMPTDDTGHVWEMRPKDQTTKHLTIYVDDARAVPSLVDDLAEQPNTIYGTGITPEGQKIKNGRYPGLEQGPPPPYPFNDGRTFGAGTTNADTNTGDGMSVLNSRLNIMGYLGRDEAGILAEIAYDAQTVDAVEQVQDDADLPITGTMDPDTWDALFDVSAVGYSFFGSHIYPLAQDSKVRKWNHTINGSLKARNSRYDPGVLQVDRNIDFGSGIDKKRMRDWCRAQLQRRKAKNWAGTITLNGVAAITGEHNPGDPAPTAADVMPARAIRPGMNAWLPNFDGGTLVHIAQVDVDPQSTPQTVTLTVDTQYRDAMELGEIIARNRDSRRDIRREWIHENRSSTRSPDSLVTFDEIGGQVFTAVDCLANTWTVFPVVAGQQGTIAKLYVQTSPAAEFCMAIFGKHVGPGQLALNIGNPFPVDDNGESVWSTKAPQEWFDDRTLLYSAGDEDQPCGYGHRRHTNRDGEVTDAPLVGWHEDAAGFTYVTFDQPVLYVAIYPDRDTTIPRGQIMWNQLQEGA